MHFSFSELQKIMDLAKRFVDAYLLNYKVVVVVYKRTHSGFSGFVTNNVSNLLYALVGK